MCKGCNYRSIQVLFKSGLRHEKFLVNLKLIQVFEIFYCVLPL